MDDSTLSWLIAVVSLGLTAVPLILGYQLTKGALRAAGALGEMLERKSQQGGQAAGDFGRGFRQDQKNARLAKDIKGENKLPGRGAFARYRARQAVARASNEAAVGRAKTEYIAGAALSNESFARTLAGGDENRLAAVRAEALSQKDKAITQDVLEMQTLIRLDPEFKGNAEKALKQAIETGNESLAKAAQNMLIGTGGGGISAFRKVIEEAEGDPQSAAKLANVSQSLRDNIQEHHGKAVKEKGADILEWAKQAGRDQKSLTTTDAPAGLSNKDLAAQHSGSIQKMVEHGKVSAKQANEILDDSRLNSGLDEKQERALRLAAAGDTRTSNPSPEELRIAHGEANAEHEKFIAHEEALYENKLRDMNNRK